MDNIGVKEEFTCLGTYKCYLYEHKLSTVEFDIDLQIDDYIGTIYETGTWAPVVSYEWCLWS